jgi:hypothetical protein
MALSDEMKKRRHIAGFRNVHPERFGLAAGLHDQLPNMAGAGFVPLKDHND